MTNAERPLLDREQESADLIDYRKMKDHVGFVFGSVRRHKILATLMFALVVVGTGTGLVVLPKSYRVEARLLLEPNPLLPSVGETGRSLLDEASSLRSAADMITRRDNLVSLIQRTDLLNYWPRHRAPALQLKDYLVRKLFDEKSEKERLDALVDFLRKRLHVWHSEGSRPNEGTVNISLDWPDGQMAFRLVEAAQQGFIEARHVAEVSAIAEATSILETHATSWRAEVVKAEEELRRVRGSKPGQAAPQSPRPAPRPAPRQGREVPDPETARLSVLLAAKRRLIDDLEDSRRRDLVDLQRRLAEQQAVYTVHHPIVINIQRSIDMLSQESVQVTALRKEEKALEAELMKHGSKPTGSTAEPSSLPHEVLRVERELRDGVEDPSVEYARTRLTFTLDKYRNLRAQAESAKLALEATRAAFKYQYTVVRPAEPPKAPTKPHIAAVSAAAVVAGLLLAAFAAVFADLRAGRIVESWQVERVLGLPILSEVREL